MTNPHIDLISDVDKKRLEKEKNISDRRLEDTRTLMRIAAFRRLAYEFLEEAKVNEDIFVSGDNGHTTSYLAGQKKMGLWFLKRIMVASPEAYVQMCLEIKSEKIQIEKEVNNQGDS